MGLEIFRCRRDIAYSKQLISFVCFDSINLPAMSAFTTMGHVSVGSKAPSSIFKINLFHYNGACFSKQ